MSDITENIPISRALHEQVKIGLIGSNTVVRDKIVMSLVEAEVQRRVTATTTILERIDSLTSEARKIKPSFTGYGADGKPVGEPIFTKDQAESLKKNREQAEKLEGAIAKALNDSDFSKVFELAAQK